MTRFQRIALTAFVCLEVLIFVGAAVRASGSGLGCPDWPFCYGCWVPPTSADQIDFTKLDIEKFRKKAAQHGRDPATITVETLRAEFDPVATWIEYGNRLTSIPVSLSVLVLLIASFGQIKLGRGGVCVSASAAFVLLLLNAWLGARVVLGGLQSGTITLHMALAILMQCVLVYTIWRGTDTPWRFSVGDPMILRLVCLIFALVAVEGIMGSQVREMTDRLARTHVGQPRAVWVKELEHTWMYLVHRSFSWLILGTGLLFFLRMKKLLGRVRWLEASIFGLILAQMCLGVVLSQIGILAVAQILHIGLSSLLVSALFLWLLAGRTEQSR